MRSARWLRRAATLTVALCAALGTQARSQVLTHANPGDSLANNGFASDPVAAVNRARKSVSEGDLPGAIRGLSLYVSAHPREAQPARYLGDLYYRVPDLAAAERTFQAVLRFAPGDRETHDRLGGIYAAQDRVAEAIDEFSKSLPLNDAYGHLVELHRRSGDLDRFEERFRLAVEARPTDASAHYALGAIYRAERKTKAAVTALERARALDPHACPMLAELGSAYLDVGRVGTAIDTFQQCLAIDPNDYSSLVNLGDAYIVQSRYDLARSALERALRVRPEGAEALVDVGYLEDVARRWQNAVSYYLRAIAIDPLARDAYVDLGYDYGEHRFFALAEAAFLKGLSVVPADGRLHYLLGVMYAEQGKTDLARAEYGKATSSDEPEVARAASRDLGSLTTQSRS